ncbi:MAG TPA: PEP-CTERM sorting domain-containing protein [Terriglobales bacterium]|nr:PEP-CTERM sorting domain-containing protein [Terriglobales bacterium]
MRTFLLSPLALCVMLIATPSMAQTVYSNGPTNGNTDAWTINFGFVVSDTFVVNNSHNSATITGFTMADWLFPGDTLISADLSITSAENGGTSFFEQTENFTQSACSANTFGFNVCLEDTAFSGPTLENGTYWINVQNAVVTTGDPIFWDENSGPSSASQTTVGSVPSESFTVRGSFESSTGTVPEPSSNMLFGSGILGFASLR